MTPDAILKQMDRAAETVVPIGDYKFTVRCPTRYAFSMFVHDGEPMFELIERSVVGWDGVTEADLLPSGASDPVPFDRALWRRWLADRTEFWEPIKTVIMEMVAGWRKTTEDDEKN